MRNPSTRTNSIKAKLNRINVLMMGSALALVLVFMLAYEYLASRDALVAEVQAQADIVRENSASTLLFNDPRAAREILAALRHSSQISSAAIYLPDGSIFSTFQKRPGSSTIPLIFPKKESGVEIGWMKLTLLENVHDIRSKKNAVIGKLFIEAELNDLYQQLLLFTLITIVAGAASLFTARLLLETLGRTISSPIQNLRNLMRRVSSDKNYALRATVESEDEVGQLAQGFNDMLHQIQQRDAELESELELRKLAESRLALLAHYDPVTGLTNRNFFNESLAATLQQAISGQNLLCVMFIDLDNFKIVNDTLGHHIGDDLLKEAAQRLAASIRKEDIICRIGGDEFAIIMSQLPSTLVAEEVATNIIQALTSTFDLHGNEIFVGASIGYSFYPHDANEASSLLRNADAAMYHAKDRGKHNFQRYTKEMESKAQRRFMLENSLRRAIEEGELEIFYQPQTNVTTGNITGFEALVRWQHAELGMVAPAEFIQIAEDTGLIVPIGELVLRTACQQLKVWQHFSSALTIGVNLSARQFKEPRIVDSILRILDESGLPPGSLELELTETTLMSNSEATLGKMERLRARDIRIAIDDFGTGYSSMNYLKRFPIHTLKIDQEFIHDIPDDLDDITITKTIIAMAHALQLEVVAEGVETIEQLAVLKESGCDKAQGYLFSRPLTAKEASKLLAQAYLGLAA